MRLQTHMYLILYLNHPKSLQMTTVYQADGSKRTKVLTLFIKADISNVDV